MKETAKTQFQLPGAAHTGMQAFFVLIMCLLMIMQCRGHE